MTLTAYDGHINSVFYQTLEGHWNVVQNLFFLHRPLFSSHHYEDLYTVPKHEFHYFPLLQTFRRR